MSSKTQQLARIIYHRAMSTLKFTLDLEEQKYEERGRQDSRYKFFKKMLMSTTYDNLRALFEDLKELDLLTETTYKEDVKDGYKDTKSGGSGYLNSIEFDEWLNSGGEEAVYDDIEEEEEEEPEPEQPE